MSSLNRVLTIRTRKAHQQYFGCKVGDQDKPWASHMCCNSCMTALNEGRRKKGNAVCSANDLERNYGSRKRELFCFTPFMKKGFNRKKNSLIEYLDIPPEICPVSHSDQLPVPEPCEIDLLCSDDAESSEESSIFEQCTSRNEEFDIITSEPHSINESEVNDLVMDLDLPKVKAELLASRLKQ